MTKVKRPEDLEAAIALALRYDESALIEEAIDARELECAVLGDEEPRASVVGEVVPGHEFYDYDDKYREDKARLLIPAPIPEETSAEVRRLAAEVFRRCGISGMARVDFFLERGTRPGAGQRAQHAARLHRDLDVSEALGSFGCSASAPSRRAHPPRAGPEGTAVSPVPQTAGGAGLKRPGGAPGGSGDHGPSTEGKPTARRQRRYSGANVPRRASARQGARGTTRSPPSLPAIVRSWANGHRETATKRIRVTGWLEPGYLLALGLLALRHYAALLGLLAFAFALGWTLTRGILWNSHLEKFLIACGLGLAVLGQLALALGLLGLFAPLPIAAVLALLALCTVPAWRDLVWSAGHLFRGRPPARVIAASALLLAPLLLLPLYPPTAFDATMYHLPYARAFISTGAVPFLPALRFPVFPQLAEALFALLLFVSGDVAAQCLQTLFTLATAGLVFLWGRRVFSRAAGALAAALYLGSPLVVYFSATAYADPALAFFSVASLYAFSRWRAAAQSRWLAVAGFFAGSAAATKYLGLFWVVLVGAAVLVARIPLPRRRAAAIFFVCALAAGLPWYVRIAGHTGNPVFPYFPQLFGPSAWDLGGHQPSMEGAGAMVRRMASVVLWPWDLVFRRERFAWHPPWSPFFLPALFFAALAALRHGWALRYAAAAVAYALFVSLAPPDPRYLMPAAALLALPAGAGIVWTVGRLKTARMRQAVLAALLLLAILPGWLYALRHARRQGPVPAAAAEKERYFERLLPAYPAIRHLNRARGDGYVLYAFFAENMPYFARGGFWGDWFGPAAYGRVLAAAGGDAEALHRTLRALGVTDLLILKSSAPAPFHADPRFPALFVPVYEDARARIFELAGVSARSSRTTSGSR